MAYDVICHPEKQPDVTTRLRTYDALEPAKKCARERAFPGVTATVVDTETGKIVFTTEKQS